MCAYECVWHSVCVRVCMRITYSVEREVGKEHVRNEQHRRVPHCLQSGHLCVVRQVNTARIQRMFIAVRANDKLKKKIQMWTTNVVLSLRNPMIMPETQYTEIIKKKIAEMTAIGLDRIQIHPLRAMRKDRGKFKSYHFPYRSFLTPPVS